MESKPAATGLGERQRVFVSHATSDKPFVRKLVAELKQSHLDLFFDEEAIEVGDSIPDRVYEAIDGADFVIVVLTPASVERMWVKMELEAAIMKRAQGKLKILPVLVEPCDIPVSLKAILYADFTKDPAHALARLKRVFTVSTSHSSGTDSPAPPDCKSKMSGLATGDLIDLLCDVLNRKQVGFLWGRILRPERMDDELPGVPLANCCLELVDRCDRTQNLDSLREQLCRRYEPYVFPQ